MATKQTTKKSVRKVNHWWVLIAVGFGLTMAMLDNTIVNVAIPTIRDHFNSSLANIQWMTTGYIAAFAAAVLIGSAFGGKFGRKKTFLLGVIVFLIGSVIAALSGSSGVLTAGRIVSGVGAALLVPNSLGLVLDAFGTKKRAFAVGIWVAISGVAVALGPLVGGLLVEYINWESIFWLNIPLGVIAFILTSFLVKEVHDKPKIKRLDWGGFVLLAASIFTFVYALIQSNAVGWGTFEVISALIGSGVFALLFLLWERETKTPLLDVKAFKKREVITANIVVLALAFGVFGLLLYLSIYFQNILGYSAIQAGLAFLPLTAFILLIAPFAYRIVAKSGSKMLLVPGLIFVIVGLVALGLMLGTDTEYKDIVIQLCLIGLGTGLIVPSLTTTGLKLVSDSKSLAPADTLHTSRELGGALGLAVLGSFINHSAMSNFPGQVAESGLPLQTQQAITLTFGGNLLNPDTSSIPGIPLTIVDTIVTTSQAALTHGIGRAALISAAVLLVAGIVVLAFLPQDNKAKSRAK